MSEAGDNYLIALFAKPIHRIVLLIFALYASPVVGPPELRVRRRVRLFRVRIFVGDDLELLGAAARRIENGTCDRCYDEQILRNVCAL